MILERNLHDCNRDVLKNQLHIFSAFSEREKKRKNVSIILIIRLAYNYDNIKYYSYNIFHT